MVRERLGDAMRRERPGGFLMGVPGGKGASHGAVMYNSYPIQIPEELLNCFSEVVRPQAEVILSKARKEFKKKVRNTQYVMNILEARDYLLEKMTPVLSDAVRAGRLDADSARRDMRGFLDLLIERNPCYRDWAERDGLKEDVGGCEAWGAFAAAIGEAEDERRKNQAPGGLTLKPADGGPLKEWGELGITFLSEERVQLSMRGTLATCNYGELGFAHEQSGRPLKAWEILKYLAQHDGKIPQARAANCLQIPDGDETDRDVDESDEGVCEASEIKRPTSKAHGRTLTHSEHAGELQRAATGRDRVGKTVRELQGRLKALFPKVTSNPIVLDRQAHEYQAKFNVGVAKSFDS